MLPNTSTIKILTNKFGSAASAMAAVEPVMPTETPQRRLHAPTVRPPQKSAKPERGQCAISLRRRGPKVEGRTCVIVFVGIEESLWYRSKLGGVYNAHDLCTDESYYAISRRYENRSYNTIYRHDFAKDDATASLSTPKNSSIVIGTLPD